MKVVKDIKETLNTEFPATQEEAYNTDYCGLTKSVKAEIESLTDISGKKVSPLNFATEILKCIDEIKVSSDSIYIKLNKSIVLESQNIVTISQNLNIQIAKQIHLNPVVKVFRKIQGLLK